MNFAIKLSGRFTFIDASASSISSDISSIADFSSPPQSEAEKTMPDEKTVRVSVT